MRLCAGALLVGVVLVGIAPASALAGICFGVIGLAVPAGFEFSPLPPSSDGQVPILGEAFGVCGPGVPPAPIQGSAISAGVPGAIRVGFQVVAHRPGCSGGQAEITLQPPYTSASGLWRMIEGSMSNITLTLDPTGSACQVATAPATACVDNVNTLCLQQKRFRVVASRSIQDQLVPGQAVIATSESGFFRFSSPDNIEVLIKVLNSCALNNRYWVLATPMTTDVGYTLTVTDTQTGATRTYSSGAGGPTGLVQDTNAFTCP